MFKMCIWRKVIKCRARSRLRSRDMFSFSFSFTWSVHGSNDVVANAEFTKRSCKTGYLYIYSGDLTYVCCCWPPTFNLV